MPATANLSFKLGETWVLDATCHDSLGNIIDVSAASIKWRLSQSGSDFIDAALGSGIAFASNGVNGEILITITPAMQIAAKMVAGYYRHQCRVTLATGAVSDQFAGSFQVTPSLF